MMGVRAVQSSEAFVDFFGTLIGLIIMIFADFFFLILFAFYQRVSAGY